jgi:hypothetical protein
MIRTIKGPAVAKEHSRVPKEREPYVQDMIPTWLQGAVRSRWRLRVAAQAVDRVAEAIRGVAAIYDHHEYRRTIVG